VGGTSAAAGKLDLSRMASGEVRAVHTLSDLHNANLFGALGGGASPALGNAAIGAGGVQFGGGGVSSLLAPGGLTGSDLLMGGGGALVSAPLAGGGGGITLQLPSSFAGGAGLRGVAGGSPMGLNRLGSSEIGAVHTLTGLAGKDGPDGGAAGGGGAAGLPRAPAQALAGAAGGGWQGRLSPTMPGGSLLNHMENPQLAKLLQDAAASWGQQGGGVAGGGGAAPVARHLSSGSDLLAQVSTMTGLGSAAVAGGGLG
jgi:hypothetical protein